MTGRLGVLAAALLASCGGGAGGDDAGLDAGRDAALDAPRDACDGSGCRPGDAGPGDAGADAAVEWPACCTPDICAPVGAACNTASCRCELVPCETPGAPCDPALLPGVAGEAVCADAPGGRFCYVRAMRPEDCPSGIRWTLCPSLPPDCYCGLGCRIFMDDCAPGVACHPWGDESGASALGICRGPEGGLLDGEPCSQPQDCASGLLCTAEAGRPFCTRPDCGLAEGAPSCPPGLVCRALDRFGQVGVCRAPCDPFDIHAPCADDEICARVGTGVCARIVTFPLPGDGETCFGDCRAGYRCIDGRCLEECDPAVTDPSATAACPAGLVCTETGIGWEHRGVCAPPCDPFSATPGADCASADYCAPRVRGSELGGACLPRPPDHGLPRLGEDCWDRCDSGLVCPEGTFGRRCRPLCLRGDEGACPAGEHCFAVLDRTRPVAVPLPYGGCERSCAPGGTDCPPGAWCEPFELDPATGRWLGACR